MNVSTLIRSLKGRLREYVGDRRHTPRRKKARYQSRLPFTLSLLDAKEDAAGASSSARKRTLSGRTRDLSETGLTLVVPAVRLGDRYLTDGESRLRITLELPTEPVELTAMPVRFKQFEEGEPEIGYLIGVQIAQMSPQHHSQYIEHLRTLTQMERRTRHYKTQPLGWDRVTPAYVNEAFESFEKSLNRPGRR